MKQPERTAKQRDLAHPNVPLLRHTHGSALIAAGWDIKEVSSRLGHRDRGVTRSRYIHAYEGAQRSSAGLPA
jgi:integrase